MRRFFRSSCLWHSFASLPLVAFVLAINLIGQPSALAARLSQQIHPFEPLVQTQRLAQNDLLAIPPVTSKSAVMPARLRLNNSTSRVELWPYVTVLAEQDAPLTIDDVIASKNRFAMPESAYATLGQRKEIFWLKIPITVGANTEDEWIFDINYSLLNHADLYLVSQDKILQRARLGNAQPFAERPIAGRSHAVALEIRSGAELELYVRVESASKILPITLSTLSAFHINAVNEQMLQGFLTSLAVCLLLYSLMQWFSLHESLYLKYCLLVFFSALFSVHFFGLGAQYLWTDNFWMERHMAGITSLCAAASTALFIKDALVSDMSPLLHRIINGVAAVLGLAAFAHGLDIIDIRVVSLLMGTLGLSPSLLAVPGAWKKFRRGDMVGLYFLLAWLGYFIASAVMVGVVKGTVGANGWTLHSFIIGATVDMIIFMRIATLRTNAIHAAAQTATLERDVLHSLAHTDPLTGLLNRRGLNATLAAALPFSVPSRILAVYVLDLDNFKPVNDQYGHDVGDELLMVVAARLRAMMRVGDAVARTGGDEFVIVATGLQTDAQAKELGDKLLEIFRMPFALGEQTCAIGITIGYALAPADGNDATSLLKHADAAMYAGKEGGKNRAGRTVPVAVTA